MMKTNHGLFFILLVSFVLAYSIAGNYSIPTWDEEASFDIAYGIRPAYEKDNAGNFIAQVPYQSPARSTIFSQHDFEQHNSIAAVVRSVNNDNSNAPLYYLSLHYLLKLVGSDLNDLRLFSIFLALLNLWLVFRISKRLFQGHPYLPVVCMLLVAANPVFFSTSFLIRGYMMALLFTLAATDQLVKMIVENKFIPKRIFFIALSAALAFLSNYFTIATTLALLICLAIAMHRQQAPKLNLRVFAGALLVFLVLAGIWIWIAYPTGIANLQTISESWRQRVAGTGYELGAVNYMGQLFNSSAFLLGFDYTIVAISKIILQGIAAVVLVALAFFFTQNMRRLISSPHVYIVLSLLIAIIIYSILAISARHFMIFERHYLIFVLPFFSMTVIAIAHASLTAAKASGMVRGLLALVVFINLVFFFAALYARIKTAGQPAGMRTQTGEVLVQKNLAGFKIAADQLRTKALSIDEVIYPDWQTAQHVNHFLRSTMNLRQRVDSSLQNIIQVKTNVGEQERIILTE
jgi:hypothetical protein